MKDFTPTTFIFGAKSAPGYYRAKGIIKFINEVAGLVNSDPDTRDQLKVVFVSNYRVSYAEKLVAAADISEQISTAGTEASGTGNMKLMLNGAVTLGTLDGANVEIAEEAGSENEYIFGATVEELEKIMPDYVPRDVTESDPKIKRVVTSLIDGTFNDGGNGVFRELYFALMEGASWHVPDHYYLLGDLDSYVRAKLAAALVMFSQGIPFMQAGQEILRSKPASGGGYVHDSYNSPDSVNSIKWDDVTRNYRIREYYRGLIAVRKRFPQFRMRSAEDIRTKITYKELGGGALAVHLPELLLLVNPSDRPLEFDPGSPANIYANGERASAEPLYQTSGAVSAAPRSVLLFSAIGTHE